MTAATQAIQRYHQNHCNSTTASVVATRGTFNCAWLFKKLKKIENPTLTLDPLTPSIQLQISRI
jgi:hypothetical protein